MERGRGCGEPSICNNQFSSGGVNYVKHMFETHSFRFVATVKTRLTCELRSHSRAKHMLINLSTAFVL